MTLTKRQRAVLGLLADGEELIFSQDGDRGWFWPSLVDLDASEISDAELQDLRDRGLLGYGTEDEDSRFGPAQIITKAGRAALTPPEDSPNA